MMQKVIITGGTGTVGRALSKYLSEKEFDVTIFTRDPGRYKESSKIRYAAWNPQNGEIDEQLVCQADYIIHLAGAGVMDKRWTKSYKKEIVESRTTSSRLILSAIKPGCNVKAIISASAIGWYGPDKNASAFTEDDPAVSDFLGETCRLWEESITPSGDYPRVCKLRTGIVFAKNEGAIKELMQPLKYGIAAIPGNGKQIMSWIHIHDLCRLYHYAMINPLKGSYNAVTPEPVSVKHLMLELGKKAKGTFFLPVYAPGFMIKLIKGESAQEILKSATVSAKKIKDAGFTFLYPSLASALKHL